MGAGARWATGSVVTLTATAETGSTFAGWSGDADCTDGVVMLAAAKSCTATFTVDTPVSYTLTIQKTGDGSDGSTVTSTPSGIACGATCTASYSSGTTVQLTAEPAEGYEFVGWQGTGCTSGSVVMSQARVCTAVFEALPCDPDGSQAQACQRDGGMWDDLSCSCQQQWEDPLVLTLDGSPIRLTNVGEGVLFDVDGDGQLEPIAWTRAGSRAAFLALDLDGDGAITTGDELLGMPAGAPRRHKPAAGDNSFTLLAAYDTPALGGNGDGRISAADGVFSRLRLWIDGNHDGVSQANELVPLSAAGITSVELTYRTTGRRDGLGNFYRYRGTVHLQSGRTVPIWDVFLATAGSSVPAACSRPEPGPFAPAPEWSDGGEPFVAEGPVGGPVGSRLDEIDPPPPTSERVEYYHLDVLGSVRVVTDTQGRVVARHDFLPFGEEWSATTGGPSTNPADKRLFTGKERDAELDLDYFGARYYRADVGRFTTIDPVVTWQENIQDPQRWNRYSYVRNGPERYVDPDGREIVWAPGLGSDERAFLTQALVAMVSTQEGRDKFLEVAASSVRVQLGVGGLSSDSKTADFGEINYRESDKSLVITIDQQQIETKASAVHAGGATTIAHELYHAASFINAPKDGTSPWLQVVFGDKPDSQTGPAKKWAQSLLTAPKARVGDALGLVTQTVKESK